MCVWGCGEDKESTFLKMEYMNDRNRINNISIIKDCFGCGVCALACGKSLIDIKLNSNGFYEPSLRSEKECTSCGQCLSVCSFYQDGLSINTEVKKAYASWSFDPIIRKKCSSGGVGFEIGKQLLNEGYNVCGVRYNAKMQRAEHYIAVDDVELEESIGSKYIQSYTLDAFRETRINRHNKFLVIGTPCQIDSFRRFLRFRKDEERFILLDFFCHSIPSILALKKYLSSEGLEETSIKSISWRNKKDGWHDSWAMSIFYVPDSVAANSVRHIFSKLSQGDVFYKLFLGDFCCNPACIKQCKYKYNKSAADIRIGDLWGKTFKKDEEGVSALVCFTSTGCETIEKLNSRCYMQELPFETVAEGQMKRNAGQAYLHFVAKRWLISDRVYSKKLWKTLFMVESLLKFFSRSTDRIKKIFIK